VTYVCEFITATRYIIMQKLTTQYVRPWTKLT